MRFDFSRAVCLSRELDFTPGSLSVYGAPQALSEPLSVGNFTGSVHSGASCNCHRVSLTPHCNGTHTEGVAHLTADGAPPSRWVPIEPLRAILLTVPIERVQSGAALKESSSPAPQVGDELVTRNALCSAWTQSLRKAPLVLLLRTTGGRNGLENPPYLTAEAASEVVARGIEHLLVELPSVDRTDDQGKLTAHRIFFGLPAEARSAQQATRAHCSITELAQIPNQIPDGPCAVQLQLAPWTGDAVPSRPLWLPAEQD